jgi:hypothetical protein
MPVDELEQVLALSLVFVVHVIGGLLLVWALLDNDERAGWRRRWRRGDGPGDPPPEPPPAPVTSPRAPLPLPGATPSRVRLREPVRAGESYPRPARRPEHAPRPARAPERA